MINRSIAKPDLLAIIDENSRNTFFGCNQEWYATEWQRRAGCGPSVASNLFGYLFGLAGASRTKENWLSLMEEVWQYVTPTSKGMPTTRLFFESSLAYARAKGLRIGYRYCDLPEEIAGRPSFAQVLQFVEHGLLADSPVAFLNLCNGGEPCLHRWHWVTIIALNYAATKARARVTIFDEGQKKEIDLSLWYKTTTLGGGFVYFTTE